MSERWRGRLEAGREMTMRQTLPLAYRTKGYGEVWLKAFFFLSWAPKGSVCMHLRLKT